MEPLSEREQIERLEGRIIAIRSVLHFLIEHMDADLRELLFQKLQPPAEIVRMDRSGKSSDALKDIPIPTKNGFDGEIRYFRDVIRWTMDP